MWVDITPTQGIGICPDGCIDNGEFVQLRLEAHTKICPSCRQQFENAYDEVGIRRHQSTERSRNAPS